MSLRKVLLYLLPGLVLGFAFVTIDSGLREHVFGGTERRTTTVNSVEQVPARRGGTTNAYRVSWTDDGGDEHSSTYRRSGRVEHQVGEQLELWVTPDNGFASVDPPRGTRVLFLIVLPVVGALVIKLYDWQAAFFERMGERRRKRRASRRPTTR